VAAEVEGLGKPRNSGLLVLPGSSVEVPGFVPGAEPAVTSAGLSTSGPGPLVASVA
jgi:hypothetical protein